MAVSRVDFSPDGCRLLTGSWTAAQLWELSSDDRPVEDLELLARLLAGQRLAPTGGLVPLEPSEPAEAWARLRSRYPGQFATTPQQQATWHRRQSLHAEDQHYWEYLLAHSDRLMALQTLTEVDWRMRARARAQLGQWTQAAADFGRLTEQPGAHLLDWAKYNLVLVQIGDRAEYRRVCNLLLERFGESDNPAVLDVVAWYCALAPGGVDDASRLVQVAERAYAALDEGGGDRRHVFLRNVGAALYRAGRYSEAVAKLEEALAAAQKAGRVLGNERDGLRLLLVMAYQRHGRTAEARSLLDEVAARFEGIRSDLRREARWNFVLMVEVLLREARLLVQSTALPQK
jgi:tetratricopeptide (TPR) repeat protein